MQICKISAAIGEKIIKSYISVNIRDMKEKNVSGPMIVWSNITMNHNIMSK